MDTDKARQGLTLVSWAIVSLISHALNWVVMAGLGFAAFRLVDLVTFGKPYLFVKI